MVQRGDLVSGEPLSPAPPCTPETESSARVRKTERAAQLVEVSWQIPGHLEKRASVSRLGSWPLKAGEVGRPLECKQTQKVSVCTSRLRSRTSEDSCCTHNCAGARVHVDCLESWTPEGTMELIWKPL